ncbi:MAG: sensor histidine kinase [Ignavibacteriales bacterium]|nr:sensor histidine kinase [Ignavibacteriales bacterium]
MSKSITKKDNEIQVTFKPRARLLLQLGDQLIKNESIALIELVKNSYDADATKVEVYMENVEDLVNGIIIIEDDGYGMDENTVANVWMEPGSDFKSKQFERREVSPKFKRLPIGEKGIGRFGAHKLGNQIEMTTKKMGSREVYIKIDWTLFNRYKYLNEVPLSFLVREQPLLFKNGKTGTNITISNLRKEWTRGVARDVKRAITSLVSPFEKHESFVAEFDITDKPKWFDGLLEWKDVKHFSLYHFRAILKDNSIVRVDYEFTPWASMSKLPARKIKYHLEKKTNSGFYDSEEKLVDKLSQFEDSEGNYISLEKYDIGEIVFEGYVFDRDAFILKLGVADKKGFKQYLDKNCGVRVFRDGLRVYDYGEPEDDWLGLDLRRVNQPSKRLSNNIVLGAVYLNRTSSFSLEEKTNREGFKENEAYDIFKNSVIHTLSIIEIFRYSDKQRLREIYGPTPKSEPVLQLLGDLKNYIDKKIKDEVINDEITKYLGKIESDYKKINENLLMAAGAGLSMSVVIHEVEKIILEVEKVLIAEKGSERVIKLVKHLSSLIDGYAEIIKKSSQTSENILEILDQALFNTEYRLSVHKIKVIKAYKNYDGKTKTKLARNLLIGSLMNIIDNSIYWLEKGKIINKKLFFDLSEEDNYTNIVIADNGTGFLLPTDEIVEPFVSAKPGGMGLGLHIANEIMSSQGGKLSFPDWGDYDIPNGFKGGAIIVLSFKNK